jgi:succinate-acetate transporter protein
MAVNIHRDPLALEVDDDPMRVTPLRRNGERVRPAVADPAPLGLAALALTTAVFSIFNTGVIDRTAEPVMFGLAVAYGGVMQLLAGMWEFRRGNTFGALTFGSYAAFWLSLWALDQFLVRQIPGAEAGNAIALYFVMWAVFSASLWVASTRTTAPVSVMLALLTAALVLLGVGNAGAHPDLIKIGGWVGLAAAVTGWYAAFAGVINSTFGRTVLPLAPLGHDR